MTALHSSAAESSHYAGGTAEASADHSAHSSVVGMPLEPSVLPTGSLAEKLEYINSHKLAGSRPVYVTTGGNDSGGGAIVRPATASSSGGTSSSGAQAKWVQPSGPRRPGEGTENEEQGILCAEQQPGGVVQLRITLLAAGFIIGPSGATVREIMHVTGCDIKSWTDSSSKGRARRPCRVFVVEGDEESVAMALSVIIAAVDRYKDLCEGRCQGQAVPRQQYVMGVEFSYQPPPRNVVPFAAALKGNITRPPVKQESLDTGSTRLLQQQTLPLLPGYLMPMTAGGFMPQGSPGTGLPFPMYMPQLNSGAYESEQVHGDGGLGGGLYGTTSFDTSALGRNALGNGGQAGGGGGGMAWGLTNPYTYTGGVDPASMMAYMGLLHIPPSPANRFGGVDAASSLNAAMGLPFSSLAPPGPASPMMMPGAMHGFGGMQAQAGARSSTSPPNPYLGAAEDAAYLGQVDHMYGQQASKAAGAAGGVGSMAPDNTAAPPYADHMSGYGVPLGSLAGCWYPPSPSTGPMGMMGGHGMMGVGMGIGGPHYPDYYHGSPHNKRPSPDGQSSSRLNPKAQPWAGSPPGAAPPPAATRPPLRDTGAQRDQAGGSAAGVAALPAAQDAPISEAVPSVPVVTTLPPAPDAAQQPAASEPHPIAARDAAAVVMTPGPAQPGDGSELGVPALAEQAAALKLADDANHQEMGLAGGGGMGKTPKRPSAVVTSSFGQRAFSDRGSSVGNTSSTPGTLDYSPTHTTTTGGSAPPGAHEGRHTISVGSCSAGTESSAALVSAEDPLISPSRFSRPGRLRRQRSLTHDDKGGLAARGTLDAASPTSSSKAAAHLHQLPSLVESMGKAE